MQGNDGDKADIIYKLTYTQQISSSKTGQHSMPLVDLAFDDEMLDTVENQWRRIIGPEDTTTATDFMQFDERSGQYDEDGP